MKRPTLDTLTDVQLDSLLEALDEIESRHQEQMYDPVEGGVQEVGFCTECRSPSPCPTIEIISRQRSIIKEDQCRSERESLTP